MKKVPQLIKYLEEKGYQKDFDRPNGIITLVVNGTPSTRQIGDIHCIRHIKFSESTLQDLIKLGLIIKVRTIEINKRLFSKNTQKISSRYFFDFNEDEIKEIDQYVAHGEKKCYCCCQ